MTTAQSFFGDMGDLYDEVGDFLSSAPTLEQIIAFRLSDRSENLIRDLLEANRTRDLAPAEQAMLDDYARIEHFMQAIKLRAFAKLNPPSQ